MEAVTLPQRQHWLPKHAAKDSVVALLDSHGGAGEGGGDVPVQAGGGVAAVGGRGAVAEGLAQLPGCLVPEAAHPRPLDPVRPTHAITTADVDSSRYALVTGPTAHPGPAASPAESRAYVATVEADWSSPIVRRRKMISSDCIFTAVPSTVSSSSMANRFKTTNKHIRSYNSIFCIKN